MSAGEPLHQSPDGGSTDNLPDPDLKIILLGDSAVGKSKSDFEPSRASQSRTHLHRLSHSPSACTRCTEW